MSSAVTASSRSGSGSTPAPPGNTPTSPPSQPLSLPDNNALAQAIWRALAESLPPLLSSLRDSSDGNTDMATTSGPLSSTSTSTQSPASSSSGTPGPTSQSSGTLVVPSFGGSSIVSTLPATSSTNLPVVVGGSCGGATGSESSRFPNLNKALVVGPGYAPVPYKLVSKITAGLFVDLADLLPDNIRAQEIEPQAFLEGKLVVSGSKKRVIEIADIVTWIEAFTIFSMILCHTFPSRWKDLNQYKLLIIQTARRFFWQIVAPLRHRLQKRSRSLRFNRLVSHVPRPLQFSHKISGYHFSCFRLLNFLCLVNNRTSGVFRQSPV